MSRASDWRAPSAPTRLTDADVAAALDCLRSGWLTMGPRTQAFEQAIAERIGTPHALTVNGPTAALHLALLALGVGAGDEVVLPALAFVANAAAVRSVGAVPVLCDVVGVGDPRLDQADLERRIGPRTRAVIAVHADGRAVDAPALKALCDARGVALVEDCTEALGAEAEEGGWLPGTVGAAGIFSLSSPLIDVGEGGFLTTADDALAAQVRSLRSHAMTSGTWDRHRGHDPAYDVVGIGYNYRLDEARAALGASRFARLDEQIASLRALARACAERLEGTVAEPVWAWREPAAERWSPLALTVALPDREARDAFRAAVAANGVAAAVRPALHELTAFEELAPPGGLPAASEAAARHCLVALDERAPDALAAAAASLSAS